MTNRDSPNCEYDISDAEFSSRTCLAVVSEGRRLAGLSAGAPLRVWDTATAETVLQLEDAPILRAFAASPNGRWFAGSLVNAETENDRAALGLWNADTGRRERFFDGPTAPITVLAFNADSTRLAAAGLRSGEVWLWDMPCGEPLTLPDTLEGGGVEALAFDPQGRFLAIGGNEGRIALWDAVERRIVAVLSGGADLAFHPCGRFLAAAAAPSAHVFVWDVQTYRRHLVLIGHLDAVTCVTYSPDGRWLASAGDDRTVRLWDADTGTACGLAETDTRIKALAFAPDGRSLFTGNGTASCYQLEVRQMLLHPA